MKLLIITQKVDHNDDVLGFFHGWIIEFAKHFEQVTVIALGVGEYHLPANVRVFSLGKELRERSDLKNLGPRSDLEEQFQKIRYTFRFYQYIWRERKNYDAVFVHMNPIYIILGAPLWRCWKKKITLWYTHRNVDMKLRLTEKLTHLIFTASQASFKIKSNKVKILGHGIPVENFIRPEDYAPVSNKKLTIICVGRITPIKNPHVLIEASALLRDRGIDCNVHFIGTTMTSSDVQYREYLETLIKEKKLEGVITFIGSVPNREVMKYYWASDISINLSPTGGIDKAVLESMAAGVPPIVANLAFDEYFGKYTHDLTCDGSAEDLGGKIIALFERKDKLELQAFLVATIEEKASIIKLIQQIIKHIS